MTDVWTYRTGLGDTTDLEGFTVHATDGDIGKIDETSTETSRQYLVVDTGFWIFGKKRMIPAGFISDVDWDEKKVFLTCTKDDVKGAPDYDEERKEDQSHRNEVGDYFDRSRYAGMHGDPVGPQAGPGRTD